eukprot:CAMPEP_0184683046 /NCGR_PEP_ID=MMETSP0312-20130426/9725_1 /TAXON_ID=31354 /ORGANISM="Compsopogon coeruleus, Strain SAG 36.94" /LENGTH=119 /DNA_ID=CAMNT_0027135091 /DNA_START=2272 /DNA_END=2628 /DNA_ORIENTATION=-
MTSEDKPPQETYTMVPSLWIIRVDIFQNSDLKFCCVRVLLLCTDNFHRNMGQVLHVQTLHHLPECSRAQGPDHLVPSLLINWSVVEPVAVLVDQISLVVVHINSRTQRPHGRPQPLDHI